MNQGMKVVSRSWKSQENRFMLLEFGKRIALLICSGLEDSKYVLS